MVNFWNNSNLVLAVMVGKVDLQSYKKQKKDPSNEGWIRTVLIFFCMFNYASDLRYML